MAKKNNFDNLSARIVELYIELNDYGYFHGPSEVDRLDRRFRGRKEILERLKNLLTQHESPSGAYLVTGFRGVGKSSLVAKALSEIVPSYWPLNMRRLLRIIAPAIVITLLRPTLLWLCVMSLFSLIILIILIGNDPRRPDRKSIPHNRSRNPEILKATVRAFILESERPPSNKKRAFWQDGLAVFMLVLLGASLPFDTSLGKLLGTTLVALLYIIFIPAAIENFSRSPRKNNNQTGKMRQVGRIIESLFFSDCRIHLQINLSQDNLKEIDILRSIASSLESELRRFMRPTVRQVFFRSLLLLPILLLMLKIHPFLKPWIVSAKYDFHIPCYLPSQGIFLFNKEWGGRIYRQELENHFSKQSGTLAFRKALDRRLEETKNVHNVLRKRGFVHGVNAGWLGGFQRNAQAITTSIDNLFQAMWDKIRFTFTKPFFGMLAPQLYPPPLVIDYSLLLLLGLAWTLPQIIFRRSVFGNFSSSQIYQQIRELNEMISAEVTQERGGVPLQANTILTFSFGNRRLQTYKVLNEREIEKRLIEIMRLCTKVSPLDIRPEFIVVFDELDKIQHRNPAGDASAGVSTAGDINPCENSRSNDLIITDVERNRQQRILSLISNLKHFLSTAPAKFIFIAGREMFDAALADVSDRQFFIGSVFNEILYVPSFHSDDSDDRLPDITSLPEQYLCSFLIPQDWPCAELTLAEFYRYLKSELLPDPPEYVKQTEEDKELLSLQRDKVIYELHNFVTYLTYRSNGAPKRLTSTLERFICSLPQEDRQRRREAWDPRHFIVGRNSKNLYLRFRYQDQYAFGLTTYLASPLIFSVNRAIKDYGDKILVSSSFVLDHIFKFHGHGFSWRNLELLPEVVDINRAPQLRELITHIMRFLARGQINEIISGLYHFKFTRRTTEEISVLSKLSEHESAAFNFTLDESLALKRHFYRQLKSLLSAYEDSLGNHNTFINSIAFLRMILGDLHYYDGEYDSAIVEYMEAVQALREIDLRKPPRPDILVLMTRNFLKLGLAFERKKAFDSALVTYGRIAAVICEIGQHYLSETTFKGLKMQLDPSVMGSMRLIYQPMLARLQLLEKATLGGINSKDIKQVEAEFSHIVGKRQIVERFLVVAEFHNKVGDILFFKNGPRPDFVYCQNRGQALCFENHAQSFLLRHRRQLPCSACAHYHSAFAALCKNYLGISGLEQRRALVSLLERFESADFNKNILKGRIADRPNFIRELGDVISDIGDTFLSCAYLPRKSKDIGCDRGGFKLYKKNFRILLEGISEIISSDSDAKIKCGRSELKRSEIMEGLIDIIDADDKEKKNETKLWEAIVHFAVSAFLFRLAANNRAASIQLIKILWLVREILAVSGISEVINEEVLVNLGEQAIRELHRSHEGTHRLEIEKLKEILEPDFIKRSKQDSVELSRLSINANVTEVLVVIKEIGLLNERSRRFVGLFDLCSPYAMFHSVYSRIHALRLRGRIHRHNLQVSGLSRSLTLFVGSGSGSVKRVQASIFCLGMGVKSIANQPVCNPKDQGNDLLESMLIDAIYCFHEIVRLLRIYGKSYMASCSMKAAAHAELADWCDYLYAYLRFTAKCDSIKSSFNRGAQSDLGGLQARLERALGKADMVHLSPNYHREMALRNWKAAIETHSEGKAYQELLEDMHYLNDDFADYLEHFCASVERFRINAGLVDKRIYEATKHLADTSIYKLRNYFPDSKKKTMESTESGTGVTSQSRLR